MEDKNILIASAVIFVLLVVAAFFVNNFVIGSNLVFIGLVILLAPYSLNKFLEFKRVKVFEDEFPNFLRDLAESREPA